MWKVTVFPCRRIKHSNPGSCDANPNEAFPIFIEQLNVNVSRVLCCLSAERVMGEKFRGAIE
jgi:hypothetical protein